MIANARLHKMIPFLRSDPMLWFDKFEAGCRSVQITSQNTKADLVFAELEADIAPAIHALIKLHPRPADIYEQIRRTIINKYG